MKKKRLIVFLVLAMVLSMLTGTIKPASAATPSDSSGPVSTAGGNWYITYQVKSTSGLNVRKSPGGAIQGGIGYNVKFCVYQYVYSGGRTWLQVGRHGDSWQNWGTIKYGWVAADYCVYLGSQWWPD